MFVVGIIGLFFSQSEDNSFAKEKAQVHPWEREQYMSMY